MGSKRREIVDAANRLFYERGYEATSFASIADVVGISRGNFYYHFKVKDELLEAVIDARLASTREMLDSWGVAATPLERVFAFIEIVIANHADIESYGCPVGTLTTELAKLGHPSRPHAVAVFELFRTWLREQFEELTTPTEAEDLAMHVLTFSQGAAALSNAFSDRDYVQREVDRLKSSLQNRFPLV